MTHTTDDDLRDSIRVAEAARAGVLVTDNLRLPRPGPRAPGEPGDVELPPGAFLDYARDFSAHGGRTDAGYRACTQWFFPRYDLGPAARGRGEGLLDLVRATLRVCLDRYQAEVGRYLKNRSYLTRVEWPSIVRYEVARGDAFHPHADNWSAASALRQFALILYLCDVAEGGETCFPEYGLEVRPRAGRALFFPAFSTHAHEARAPKSGDKWVVVAWLRYPDLAEGERPYGPGFELDP